MITISNQIRSELFQVLLQTMMQAALSSVLSLIFGIVGALGLLYILHSGRRRLCEVFVMLPSLMPVLFIIVASMNLVSIFANFPFGFFGVVIIHVAMNIGLVSVAMARLIEGTLGGVIELAAVEGATRIQILKVSLMGLRREVFIILFLIFSLSFASFSVPLIVGAGSGDTIEVLIYRAILGRGDLRYGLGLAGLQICFLFLFSLILKNPLSVVARMNRNLVVLQSRFSLVLLLSVTAALLLSSFSGLNVGFMHLLNNSELRSGLFNRTFGTFFESTLVGFLILFSLFVIAYKSPHYFTNKILLAFVSPSAVVTGLIIYLIFNAQEASSAIVLLWVSLGFAITIFPLLYRFRGASVLSSLESQIFSARIMGASHFLIFKEILLPQVWRDFMFISGVGALWASGDFALSSLIAGRELTLAMTAQTLLGGYRMEVATVVTWCSFIVGVSVFLIFEGLGRVAYSKSRS